jgi:hypothetical protein
MSRGMSGRDALRIQLFLRGYGVKPWDVREALRREYGKHLRTASAKIRSTYLDNNREIGERHKASLRKRMGELDNRLKDADLEMPTDFYIEMAPLAKCQMGVLYWRGSCCLVHSQAHFRIRLKNRLISPTKNSSRHATPFIRSTGTLCGAY